MVAEGTNPRVPEWANGILVFRSTQRHKTATVAVGLDLIVSVRVPAMWSDDQVSALLDQRESWLAAQVTHFNRYEPRTPARSFVNGETHRHLGKQLMLRVVLAAHGREQVEARGHELVVAVRRAAAPNRVAALLGAWQRREAYQVFSQRLAGCRSHYLLASLPEPRLQLRTMIGRWGSMSSRAVLTLNPDLVQAPIACIDCVIQHECCHLLVPNHSPAFLELMDQVTTVRLNVPRRA